MGIVPKIVWGKVMHARTLPRKNHFTYGLYYLALPLAKLDTLPIPRNRFGLMSFYERDHGACDGSNLENWARAILADYDIKSADGEITLICMPRILGYVFNPVSFWLCHDKQGALRAVLCEVNNTFGERHTYLCAHEDHRPITASDTLTGEKLFHVSPFLPREGRYNFSFDATDTGFKTGIDYYNEEGKKQLVTSLVGSYQTMSKQTCRKAFWSHPLVTFKAIMLIHWQALKLVIKGATYFKKPKQKAQKQSATDKLNKIINIKKYEK